MNELIRCATADLSHYLGERLPLLSPAWWDRHVVDRLTFQQQRTVRERRMERLEQLDFAALIRVLDQNWPELISAANLPREARTWVKELQTVRNKWAHLSAEAIPPSEIYRDADTLARLLEALGAQDTTLAKAEALKTSALAAMAPAPTAPAAPARGSQAATLFQAGQLVCLRSDPSALMSILEVLPGAAECRYRVFWNNARALYYESQLQAVANSEPEVQVQSAADLQARLTGFHLLNPSTANLFSLREGRVNFVPYQYRPVMKLVRSDKPRLLIADEVGVGKTIEAGLILKELQARMEIRTVLIICPKVLVAERKWHAEMRRFDESFTALDGPALRDCLREVAKEGEWPDEHRKAILPFSLFDSDLLLGREARGRKREPGLLALDPPPRIDLVIVDEAHHLRNPDTYLHQGVRFLSQHAQAVLLLTATPVQLGSRDLFTLLNLLRPDVILDPPSFQQMAEPNRAINAAVQLCRAGAEGWQQGARASLDEVARTEWGRQFLREEPAFQAAYDILDSPGLPDPERVGLVRSLEELYTFSPYINRTRRRDIGQFTTRKPETVPIEFTSAQKDLHDGLLRLIETILTLTHGQQNLRFMTTTVRRQAASCLFGLAPLLEDMLAGRVDALEAMESGDREDAPDLGFVDLVKADVQALLTQARQMDPTDPKVDAFLQVLRDKQRRDNNKALVFSTFRHTLSYLQAKVQTLGLRVGLIHGLTPEEERTSLRMAFALDKAVPEAIDVLLSSEIGCEGLDFQHCDLLVNYDLPWNPMRVEQRIGRIDRYGQKSETVAIINFITPGTVDADIYQRCLWRIGVFQHAVGGSEEILGELAEGLHDLAQSFTLTEAERAQRLQQLSDNLIRQVQEENDLEAKQAELFGLDLPGQTWRDELAAAESFWLSPAALQGIVSQYLAARLGSGDCLLGDKPVKTLRLGQEARAVLLADHRRQPASAEPVARAWDKWLRGAVPTLAVTFDQAAAQADPGLTRLSVQHPLVRQAAHSLALDQPIHVSLAVQSPDLPKGRHPFALYRWRKQGLKPDETLVAVATDPRVAESILAKLSTCRDGDPAALPAQSTWDDLDVHHHRQWLAARADHISANQQLAEYRVQSLTASHRARRLAIDQAIQRATNDKIRLMKQSELVRADREFADKIEAIQASGSHADIYSAPLVLGVLDVSRGDRA